MAMVKLGRNDLCWCKSGMKYKKCCLFKQEARKVSSSEYGNKNIKEYNHRVCLAKGGPFGECKGRIVRSHSISKSSSLDPISNEAGEVYGYKPTTEGHNPDKYTMHYKPELIPARRASTFYGFCKHHDQVIFSPIENKPFVATTEQCFLLAYRTLARDLHVKIGQLNSSTHDHSLEYGRSSEFIHAMRTSSGFTTLDARRQIQGFKETLDAFEQTWDTKDFSSFRSIVFEFSSILPIMCTSSYDPSWSEDGLLPNRLESTLFYCAFASGGRSYIVLTCHRSNALGIDVIRDYSRLRLNKVTSQLVPFIFFTSENICIEPQWWDNLDIINKYKFLDLYKAGIIPGQDGPSMEFKFGIPICNPVGKYLI